MNKFKKYLIITIVVIGLGIYIGSLVKHGMERQNPNVIQMWTAPTDFQMKFWTTAAEKWNKLGKGMKVVVNQIPAANSSEEAILNSIASRTSPDISTNIFDGFSAQLASLGAIYNLKDFEGFDKLVKERKMETIMEPIKYEGQNYMFPVLVLPTPYGWRWDILQKLGWNDVPKTYSDVYKLAKQFCTNKLKYVLQVSPGRNWWNRWNDFISLYYAATDGKPYIENNKAVFNNKSGKEVLGFFEKMYDNGWAPNNTQNTLYFQEGTCVGKVFGPYDIDFTKKNYPEIMNKIKLGPMVVPDGMEAKGYCFMDIKGLVVFKSSLHAKEAWEFAKWVFSSEEMSLSWMEISEHPAARGDLLTNPKFKEFFENDHILKETAKMVPYGKPSAPITKTAEVQTVMTDDLVYAIVYKTKTIEQALKAATNKINDILAED